MFSRSSRVVRYHVFIDINWKVCSGASIYFRDSGRIIWIIDTFPLVSIEGYVDTDTDTDTDTDGDGRPNECNTLCTSAGMTADTDDDNDGVPDNVDAFPLVSLSDLLNTDGDGYPNDRDSSCEAAGMTAHTDSELWTLLLRQLGEEIRQPFSGFELSV